MEVKGTLRGATKEGFEVEVQFGLDEYEQAKEFFSKFAVQQITRGVAVVSSSNSALSCQFCNAEVKGTRSGSTNYTAEQIVKSRSEKMGKLGQKALAVCGKCWTEGGWLDKWNEYYIANSSR